MGLVLDRSFALQCIKCGNTIKICNRIKFLPRTATEQLFRTDVPVNHYLHIGYTCLILLTRMVSPTQACHGTFLTEARHQILGWATADSGLAHQGERSSVRWEKPDLPIGPYNVSLCTHDSLFFLSSKFSVFV